MRPRTLSALPGQGFLVVPVGTVTPPSDLQVPLVIPDDPLIRGATINLQAVVLSSEGLFVSNAVTRVIGE